LVGKFEGKIPLGGQDGRKILEWIWDILYAWKRRE
jgi:hypothetical protein